MTLIQNLRQCGLVTGSVSQSNNVAHSGSSRDYRYTKVLDNRKHPIRGLWRRNGKFLARITVEDGASRKEIRWVPLPAKAAAEAQDEFRKLMVERTENRLRHIGLSPTFGEFYSKSCLPMLNSSGKKSATIVTEKRTLQALAGGHWAFAPRQNPAYSDEFGH